MKSRLLITALLVVLLAASSAIGQMLPDSHNRPTAQQLFDRYMLTTVTTAGKSGDIRAAVADTPIAMLCSSGSLVETTADIALCVISDYGRPVFIVYGVFSVDDLGQASQIGHALYVAEPLSLTAEGSGYFPALYAGGVIPIGKVSSVGNTGQRTTVEVIVFDALTMYEGGKPVKVLRTSFWFRMKPAASTARVTVNSATVAEDGETIRLAGVFPSGERLVTGIGALGFDLGFVETVSNDGTTLLFRLPKGHTGNPLNPWGRSVEMAWSIVILAGEESFSFPRVFRVRGDINRPGVFPVQ